MQAALRRGEDYIRDGVLFSEGIGIVVGCAKGQGRDPKDRYRIRNKTAQSLYEGGYITHQAGGGLRGYVITDKGRAAANEYA